MTRDADVAAVLECLRSGWLTMGPRTQAFEAAFAEWVGTPHAVAVSSGTAGLQLACRAAGVGPGDEVLVPAVGAAAAAEAARLCGAEPVFCDVVSVTLPNLDVVDAERRITERMRAVVAAHVFGYPADAVLLREVCDRRSLVLIEDCTQAVGATLDHHGRQAGTVGDLGCFSFADGRQLAVGEGGMVVSAREELAATVRSLRQHAMTAGTWDRHRGYHDTYDIVDFGFNFRIDEARAALGTARLHRLREEIEARRATARALREALGGREGVALCWEREDVSRSSHAALPLLFEGAAQRDRAAAAFAAAGVATCIEPLAGDAPRASEFAARHVAIVLGGELDTARVASAF